MAAPMRRYAAPPATAPRILLGRIPKGYAGTLRTAAHVQRLIREGAKDFYVRQKAIDILLARGVRPKHYLGEIEALFQWVQRHVRYTKDPFRVEVLHSPRRMLELRAGDCDDMTILLGSLLESIGHPVRLVLTGPDPSRPRLFSHIYLEVNHHGRWIACDATMPHPLGWAPRAPVKQVIATQEEPSHVIRPSGIAGTASRHRGRGDQGAGSPGAESVESAPEPGAPRPEPVAQAAAALHVGEGTRRPPAAQNDRPTHGAPSALGDPASRRRRRASSAPAGDGARWAAAFAAAPAGDRPAGREGAASGAAGPGALSALHGYLRNGTALYHWFHRFRPERTTRVAHSRLIPPVLVQLGDLVGLIYRSDKWHAGEPRTYIHFMRRRPRLLCDIGGRQLFLLGGSYRVTARGIEG